MVSKDIRDSEHETEAQYASPPCFMHELQEDFRPRPHADAQAWADVSRWRKAERQRQIEARLALSASLRGKMTEGIAAGLDLLIGDVGGRLVSYYWPFRGEPDLRAWAQTIIERGGRTALPLVVAKGRPLVFREWKQGEKLERGVWNIPIPAEGDPVHPDIVVAPLVGYDPSNYRLGYGGGFFDRTLASLPRKPLIIGIGYGSCALPTIYPQPHDIPMDAIVTEAGVVSDRR
jgi:5,10-methenyltetrahydrofolate synthetase